jgi:hypothetical protein
MLENGRNRKPILFRPRSVKNVGPSLTRAISYIGQPACLKQRAVRLCAFLAGVILAVSNGRPVMADQGSSTRTYSGWRGGIGIASETPSRNIPDVTEMGYEMVWGGEDPRAVRLLDLSVFRYWNSIVETSLKDAAGAYDFSAMADKDEAARLAFDAAMAHEYGVKGLSKYAKVRYRPEGAYGDVYGSMDLSSENELTKAVMTNYLDWFKKHHIAHGGIGLDNAGGVPQAFLEVLTRTMNAQGLGIAANGCPDKFLPYIDFFGNEGFPFSIAYARQARQKGLRGILGEFTMQHLSGGELEEYLKSKLFNGIVFFGYTDGGVAAGAACSAYSVRPDVYEHQRWVLRKFVPLSRAMQKAGRQENAGATLAATPPSAAVASPLPAGVQTNAEGKVREMGPRQAEFGLITGRSPATPPAIFRYGANAADGIMLYADSGKAEEVTCDAKRLGLPEDALVFDEFAERVLPGRRSGGALTFRTARGPSLIQLGNQAALLRSILARVEAELTQQLLQRAMDRELATRYPQKVWPNFCQGWKLDTNVAHSGRCSLRAEGGTYTAPTPQWKYFNRQGAAQLVSLNQLSPERVVLRAWSRSDQVTRSEQLELNSIPARRHHFGACEGHTYCLHLYLDYQDGEWPEVRTVTFTAGSHDWEEKTIQADPTRPVKTVLVLLEFHQPQGSAWFDDVVLTQGNKPGQNLLACPGFEANDSVAAKASAASPAYEDQVRSILLKLEGAQQSAQISQDLPGLAKQAEALEAWVVNQGLSPCFSRELRDLDEMRGKLRLCSRIMLATP